MEWALAWIGANVSACIMFKSLGWDTRYTFADNELDCLKTEKWSKISISHLATFCAFQCINTRFEKTVQRQPEGRVPQSFAPILEPV